MDELEIRYFIEAALLAAGRPLNVDQLQNLFDGRSAPEKSEIRMAIQGLNEDYEQRGILIAEVASGFRMQVTAGMAERLHKLWEERPPRYSRALFETLALIAYRQPITRGEIEEIRGVSVSSNIVRTLMERDWVRVVGHRDVPGRPAMFGTTKAFLDYFGLKRLDDLPPLADLSDWESLRIQLNLPEVEEGADDMPELMPDVPVLHPEADAAGREAEPESTAPAGEGNVDIPELAAVVDGDDETSVPAEASDSDLVVSEWPDPAESGGG